MKSIPTLLSPTRTQKIRINRFRTPAFALVMAFSMVAPDVMALTGTIHNNLNPRTAKVEGVLFSGDVRLSDQPLEEFVAPVHLNAPIAPAPPVTEYSIHAEGIATVGVSKDDPTNNPSDDVFTLDIQNKSQGDYILSYQVYGVASGASIPKSINYRSTYRDGRLEASQQWTTTHERILAQDIKEGENKVHFTLPTHLNAGAKIQNVRMTPVTQFAGDVPEMASFKPLQLDNRGFFEVQGALHFSVAALDADDMPSFGTDKFNVTLGAEGYRLLSTGPSAIAPGAAAAFVSVKIDRNRLPSGTGLDEVRLYYYDRGVNQWAVVPGSRYDEDSQSLMAPSVGETDYVAGVLQHPEMPQASGFVPTSISGLDAANPAAGMNLMQPPTANSSGAANISYPLEIPAGRNGMQPSLALTYSNEGGSSWVGYGWGLSAPSITIDTRWGAPRFDANYETELYNMGGELLVYPDNYLPHRSATEYDNTTGKSSYSRTGGTVRFFTQVTGGNSKIERKGTSTSSYYWVVTTADNTVYYYGSTDGTSQDGLSTLKNDAGHAVQWFLTKVKDKWGNEMTYDYESKTYANTSVELVDGSKSMYLSGVNYSGHDGTSGKYDVEFVTKSWTGRDYRIDGTIKAKRGSRIADIESLSKVIVKYDGTEIKRYELGYSTGPFYKTQLTSISEFRGNTLFTTHDIEYYDEPTKIFETSHDKILKASGVSIDADVDALQAFDFGDTETLEYASISSPLGTSKSNRLNVGAYVGLGILNTPEFKPTLSNSLGGQVGYGHSWGNGKNALGDFNGDGLPDFTHKSNSQMYFYPTVQGATIDDVSVVSLPLSFTQGTGVSYTIRNNYRTASNSWTYGASAYPAMWVSALFSVDYGKSNSISKEYFMDYNADGIKDLVKVNPNDKHEAIVFFGRVDDQGDLVYSNSSEHTPSPVIKAAVVVSPELDVYDEPVSLVKVWKAPKTGTVLITDVLDINTISGDGIELSIQKSSYNATTSSWTNSWIKSPYTRTSTISTPITSYNSGVSVNQGDYILFRVHPKEDGIDDYIEWDHSIDYNSGTAIDAEGIDWYNSSYKEGFLLTSPSGTQELFEHGNYSLSWSALNINDLSDDVTFKIIKTNDAYYYDDSQTPPEVVSPSSTEYTATIAANTTTSLQTSSFNSNVSTLSFQAPSGLNTHADYRLEFIVESTSNIDWTAIDWRPVVTAPDGRKFYPVVHYGVHNDLRKWSGSVNHGTVAGIDNFEVKHNFSSGAGSVSTGSEAQLVVKAGNKLAGKITLTKTALGVSASPASITFTGSDVANNDDFYFEYYTEDADFLSFLKSHGQYKFKKNIGSFSTHSSVNVYSSEQGVLGTNYLNWGQFSWSDNDHNLLNPSDFKYYASLQPGNSNLPDAVSGMDDATTEFSESELDNFESVYNLKDHEFGLLLPVRGEYFKKDQRGIIDRYKTMNDSVYVSKQYYKPGRITEFDNDYIDESLSFTMSAYSAYGLVKKTRSNSKFYNAGGSWSYYDADNTSLNPNRQAILDQVPSSLSAGWTDNSSDKNQTWETQTFLDFNGDGFPDNCYLDGNDYKIQFTNPLGGHRSDFEATSLSNLASSVTKSQKASSSFGKLDLSVSKPASSNGGDEGAQGSPEKKSPGQPSSGDDSSSDLGANESQTANPSNPAVSDRLDSESFNPKWSLGVNGSRSENIGQHDWVDVNGDGLLDQIETYELGGYDYLKVRLNKGYSFLSAERSEVDGQNINAEVSPDHPEVVYTRTKSFGLSVSAGSQPKKDQKSGWSAGIGGNMGVSHGEAMFLDINGDGLQDRVVLYEDNDDNNKIKSSLYLNLGTRFKELNNYGSWGYNEGYVSNSSSSSLGPSSSFTVAFPVFPALNIDGRLNPSSSYSYSTSRDHLRFMDVNGDGFTDILSSDLVSPKEAPYPVTLAKDEVAVWFNQMGKTGMLKKVTNPLGGSFTLDYEVIGNKYGMYTSEIDLSSDNNGKTYWDMPTGKWVLKSTTVHDGLNAEDASSNDIDGTDSFTSTFTYDGGLHSRRDREFIGFQKVQVLAPGGVMSSVTEYHRPSGNDRVKMVQYARLKGKPSASYQLAFHNGTWEVISKSELQYVAYELDNNAQSSSYGEINTSSSLDWNSLDEEAVLFIGLLEKESINYYNHGATQNHSAKQTFTYNDQLNVEEVLDHGLDVSTAVTDDDILVEIDYYAPSQAGGRMGVVKDHQVKIDDAGSWSTVRHTEAILEPTNKLYTVEQKAYLDATTYAQSDYVFDTYGNVTQMKGPENSTGQRETVEVTYDNVVHSYPIKVENVFGDSTQTTYDYGTGQVLTSEDLNGNQITYTYDDFFRVEKILGPNEDNGNAGDFTIRYQYFPKGRNSKSTDWRDQVPVAVTFHYQDQGDASNPYYVGSVSDDVVANPGTKEFTLNGSAWIPVSETNMNHLMTATFTDGTGSAVQVKKDISVWNGSHQEEKRQVSGAAKLNARGLVDTLYLSSMEDMNLPILQFNNAISPVNPTTTTYDYLSRPTAVSSPDAAGTGNYTATVAYSWETKGGNDYFVTTSTDPDGRVGKGYADARGQQRFTVSDPSGENVETEFFYDVLGQVTSTQSVDGETTSFTYDNLGRMTQEVHPDRGTTTTDYDLLGQVVSTTTANADTVRYTYDFSRLTNITYPTSGSLNDVAYTYGSRGDGINGAGRITEITQGSATAPVLVEQMNYDDLGNVAVHTREIDIPNVGLQSFTSKTQYDSWGRILKMTYPDGEQVRYFHSYGGDLFRINGYDLGNAVLASPSQVYVAQLGYDQYGNRTYMEYGNSTKTTFAYNAHTLRLHRVTALTSTNNSTGAAQTMIDKTFGYSAAGNIDQINNTATPMSFTYNSLGGGYLNQYTYDGLNRLTAATGSWTGSTGPETYSINMAYDKMGGITWKNQGASLNYPGYPGQKYNYYYTHGNTSHPHATSKIWDRRNHTQYTYGFDANGNPTTTHEQYAPPKQGKANPSGPISLIQQNYWDERNQLRGLWNTSGLNHYIYDADGQRLMKSTLPMAHSSVDAQQLQATNSFPLAQYTVYVNAGLVYESDGGPATYTKHYYAGPLRVASHIGSGNPNQVTHPTSGGNLTQGGPAGSTGSSNGLAVLGDLNGLLAHYGMAVSPAGLPTDTISLQAVNDPSECDQYYGTDIIENNRCLCDYFPDVAAAQGIDCSPYAPIYWYHPDYIGNVEFVSDRTGQPYQHFYYAPFGDPMVSQHVGTGSFNSDFRFNAKEFDEETGNYYYGARYYDPKVSVWLSVDPKAHWYLGHSPYNFSLNNPINLVDPNGQWVEGAGFWNNLFYSDKRNEAMLLAGENGSFEKTDDGWRLTRSNQSSSDNQGDFQGEMLNEVEIIDLKDDGERSIDDHAANMVRGVANTGIIVGTALVMPFVALAKNKNIDWEAGDKYTSANPYRLREDVGWEQMDGSTSEVGKEVMKATVGTILFSIPATHFWKGQAVTTPVGEGMNKVIDTIEDD